MKSEFKNLVKILLPPFIVFMVADTLDKAYNPMGLATWGPNMLFHFLGGLSMAISGFFILNLCKNYGWIKISSIFIDIFIIIIFVISVAVVWEFYELLVNFFGLYRMELIYSDTMKDLFMGTVGAATFCLGWLMAHFIKSYNLKKVDF